jgi:GT2 family glycosyltransferase
MNRGFAGGNNVGIKACNGKYVVLLNNDTKVTKGWLEEMVKMAESDDRIGIVGCKLLYPDNTIQHAGVGFKGLFHFHIGVGFPKEFYYKPREFKAVTFACVLIKREVFDSGVWLDEGYHPALFEDIDFCFQALEKGWRIMYCPNAIVYHYESTTLKNVFQKRRHKIFRKNFLRFKQKWRDKDPIRPKAKIPRIAYDARLFLINKIDMLRLIALSFFFRFYFHLKLKPLKRIFNHLPVTFTASIRTRWRDWIDRRKYKDRLRKLR